MNIVAGYLDRQYAESLSEFGRPRFLTRSGAWILERPIPSSKLFDAMGCYPLFACRDWSQLHCDLESIKDRIVTLSLVTDPFGDYTVAFLKTCFDVVVPFKEHFIVDLSVPLDKIVSPRHRYSARRSLREVQVELCSDPMRFLEEWQNLYAVLIKRHNIKGIPALSMNALAKQLVVPGIVMLRAVHEDVTVGMILWYLQGQIAYYHLGAYSEAGYQRGASFALFWHAIYYFTAQGLRWLNLGAAAGIKGDDNAGLSRFKRGWSTGTRTAYFCGRILNQSKYDEILKAKHISASEYFPSYRRGEFG